MMSWQAPARSSSLLKRNWANLQTFNRLDPYIVWHDLTSSPGAKKQSPRPEDVLGSVCALVEFASVAEALNFFLSAIGGDETADFPSISHTNYVMPTMTRFLTILIANVDAINKLFDLQYRGRLVCFEIVASRSGLRVQAARLIRLLQVAVTGQLTTQGHAGAKSNFLRQFEGAVDREISIEGSFVGRGEKQSEGKGKPLVVVIDDGFNFASRRIRDSVGSPRLSSMMWNQNLNRPATGQEGRPMPDNQIIAPPSDEIKLDTSMPGRPGLALRFPFGALYGHRLRLHRLLQNPDNDDMSLYRRAGYLRETPNWTHGVSMVDLILNGTRSVNCPGSSAGPSDVLLIQLPDPTVEDTSGGSLSGHALDGIHHALTVANGRPVIVNLSYGTHSGPHDGSSLFERSLRHLLDRFENLHVVLPAGNTHLARCHASGWLTTGHRTKVFKWKVLPDDPTDSYLEVWLTKATPIVRVTSPNGVSGTIGAGSTRVLDSAGVIQAVVVFPRSVAQCPNGTMVLVALAPTRRILESIGDDQSSRRKASVFQSTRLPMLAPHGVWTIEVTEPGKEDTRVDLWVQRDDAAPGGRRARRGQMGRQSYLLETGEADVDPGTTLSGIATATHPRLFVVGAMRRSDSGISDYSASGPNRIDPCRTEGPDAVVVADESTNVRGVVTSTTLGGGAIRVGGTSVAAARLSRMLYEHLAKGRTADSFVWSEPDEPSPTIRTAAGSPAHAAYLHRGEHKRMWAADPADDPAAKTAEGECLSVPPRMR